MSEVVRLAPMVVRRESSGVQTSLWGDVGVRCRPVPTNSCSVDETGAVGYDSTFYRGCAVHYWVGRPPYSADLEAALVAALGLDGTGRLLDAGCGPGMIALRLAGQFTEVVGLDPDADMLMEASRHASMQGVNNVSWVCAVAEALPDAAPGPYRLVTFGQSFRSPASPVKHPADNCRAPAGPRSATGRRAQVRPPPSSVRPCSGGAFCAASPDVIGAGVRREGGGWPRLHDA